MVLSGYLRFLLHQEMPDPKQGTPCARGEWGHDFQKNEEGLIILLYEQQLEKAIFYPLL